MHRTDAPGNVNGLFNDGNPAAGQQATALVAAWFNDIQENLAYVIEEQGIVLEKGDYTQLSDAIVALVSGAVGDGSGNVPTTRNIFTSGLALGGGTLAVDRTINVPKATAAEVAAGADDSKAITPLALIGGVGARLLAGTGYATLLGGIILQWGTATANANGSTTVTLPITFPNQCVHAEFGGGAPATNAQDNNPYVSGRSASALTLFSALDGAVFGTFFAIGF
jgi:hypothetical protein